MVAIGTIYNEIMVRISFEFERTFHLLLYAGLIGSAMIIIVLSIDAWGLLYASTISVIAIICTAIFWKIQSHFVRSFRSGLLLVLLLLLAFPTWVLLGFIAHGLPVYLTMVPITVGVFALFSGSLLAWFSWVKVNFVEGCGLSTMSLAKWAVSLPEDIQNQNVLNAFGSMARISWLFANNEFSLVISIVGSSIESLLREIYPKKGAKVGVMIKALDIDVSYEYPKYNGKELFTVTYFWHEVRGKYAHLTGLEKLRVKQFYTFNVVKEPSEETAMMSIGLLGVFLKAYSNVVQKQKIESTSEPPLSKADPI
jgi:hypothetical protein